MKKIEEFLSEYGYRVINVDYPSTEHPIEYLANNVLSDVIARFNTRSGSKINFITHSLGGIIVRYYLKHHKLTNLGRVVMLSPPNKGSELVDNLKESYFFKKRHGPAGQQLGTDKESLPLNLGPVDFDLGVITGNISFNLISSMILPGPDDGVVSVESAKVEGMTDFIVMPNSHTFIMKNKNVIKQIIHFLENGEFDHSKSR
jgi:pimeloyl-ACP methyl ester carboxylesterase